MFGKTKLEYYCFFAGIGSLKKRFPQTPQNPLNSFDNSWKLSQNQLESLQTPPFFFYWGSNIWSAGPWKELPQNFQIDVFRGRAVKHSFSRVSRALHKSWGLLVNRSQDKVVSQTSKETRQKPQYRLWRPNQVQSEAFLSSPKTLLNPIWSLSSPFREPYKNIFQGQPPGLSIRQACLEAC